MRYSRRGLGSWLRSQPCGQQACCTTGCAALCARNCSLAPGAARNIRLRVEKSAPDRCRLCTVAIYFRRSVSDFCVCVHPTGKRGKREESWKQAPNMDRIEEASTEHYRRCYQHRILKNIHGSILVIDVGKRDFAGAGHLRCCAQSRVF